jgi:hypothetical protein
MRKMKEIASWLLALTMGVGAFIVVANFIPPPEGHVTFDSGVENDSGYTVWYGFSDGSWSTLRHNPITGERGWEITEQELKTLKLAE